MLLIIAIGGVIFTIIGRVMEIQNRSFIFYKLISYLIAILCLIKFIYDVIKYDSYFTNTSWEAFFEVASTDYRRILIYVLIIFIFNLIPSSFLKK